ncbi:MAG: hypothetical protein EOO73_19780 [Myxococcales bacterium]|nr:MAG: hypothetical protein EOO73_19780 [Myxococcales bacterium]
MSGPSLVRHERGAVFVEHLIAYLPVLFFFLATWQLIELCAARLIVQRAASAAARAAIVILPDDPAFYQGGGEAAPTGGSVTLPADGSIYQNHGNPGGYNEKDKNGDDIVQPPETQRGAAATGEKGVEITLAAAMILAANPHLGQPKVAISGGGGSSVLRATVRAPFACFAGWVSLICGPSGSRELTATSTHVYQGARYSYQP